MVPDLDRERIVPGLGGEPCGVPLPGVVRVVAAVRNRITQTFQLLRPDE